MASYTSKESRKARQDRKALLRGITRDMSRKERKAVCGQGRSPIWEMSSRNRKFKSAKDYDRKAAKREARDAMRACA